AGPPTVPTAGPMVRLTPPPSRPRVSEADGAEVGLPAGGPLHGLPPPVAVEGAARLHDRPGPPGGGQLVPAAPGADGQAGQEPGAEGRRLPLGRHLDRPLGEIGSTNVG